VLLIYGVGAAIGNILGGQLSDRLGVARTVTIATFFNAVMLVLISAIGLLPQALAAPVFVTALALWGTLTWAFPPAQASRIVALAPDSAPLALSLNGSALYLGVALGSFVGGVLVGHGAIRALALVAAIFPLAGLAVMGLTRVADRRPRPDAIAVRS
jgi:predicted MFS family arabinose efflux permease